MVVLEQMKARHRALKRKLEVSRQQQQQAQQQKRNSITSAPSSAPVGRSSPLGRSPSSQGAAR
jgi:hypothetical protein